MARICIPLHVKNCLREHCVEDVAKGLQVLEVSVEDEVDFKKLQKVKISKQKE